MYSFKLTFALKKCLSQSSAELGSFIYFKTKIYEKEHFLNQDLWALCAQQCCTLPNGESNKIMCPQYMYYDI